MATSFIDEDTDLGLRAPNFHQPSTGNASPGPRKRRRPLAGFLNETAPTSREQELGRSAMIGAGGAVGMRCVDLRRELQFFSVFALADVACAAVERAFALD